jgi:GTP:adenosylcobinamide-phosphate guanylyltransferase
MFSGLYQQLISEGGQEKFDDRRVYLLKCQVTQLERQLMLQSEAIQSRVSVMSELDILVTSVMEKLRAMLSEGSESVVTMSRSYVRDLVQNLESVSCSMWQTVQVPMDWLKYACIVSVFDACRSQHLKN